MPLIEILYSSSEGQALRVAERLRGQLLDVGFRVQFEDVKGAVMMQRPDAIVLVASIHGGKHPSVAAKYVRDNIKIFRGVPTGFISVSLRASEADRTVAQEYVSDFLWDTGWKPDVTATIAGALRYTQYSFVKKFVIRSIASRNGLPTDTSQDYEFTDWDEVAAFGNAFAGIMHEGARV